jgi:hypothetical protein
MSCRAMRFLAATSCRLLVVVLRELIPGHDQWEIIPERPAPVISPGAEPDRVMTLRCLASRLSGAGR